MLSVEHVQLAAKVAAKQVRNGGPYFSEPIDSGSRQVAAEALEAFADLITYTIEDLQEKARDRW